MTRKDLSIECLKYQLFFEMEVAKNHRFPGLVGSWADQVQLEVWRKELEIKETEEQNAYNEAVQPEHEQSQPEHEQSQPEGDEGDPSEPEA